MGTPEWLLYIGCGPLPVTVEFFVNGNPLLNMFHNPGGHCYWVGAIPNIYVDFKLAQKEVDEMIGCRLS